MRIGSIASLLLVGLAAPVAVVAQCSGTQYNTLPGYTGGGNCYPTTYYAAEDQGQLDPSALPARCEARCTAMSQCIAFVGQYQTAPNGLSTGQCYFYSTIPSGPRKCADAPTGIVAESKDMSLACFSSSTAAATAYCSSYLGIGTVTQYTSTTTPLQTNTQTSISTQTSVQSSISATSTTSISTIINTATLTQTSTSTVISQTTTTTTSLATTTSTTVSLTTTVTTVNLFNKRASVPAPACLATTLPASRISSACSCLSIKSTTVSRVSTAPVSLTATTTLTTSITLTTTVSSTTSLIQSTTFSTTSTTVTVTSPTTTTTTAFVTAQSTITTVTTTSSTVQSTFTTNSELLQNTGFESGISPWATNSGSVATETVVPSNPHSGTYALKVTLNNPSADPDFNVDFQQSVTLPNSNSGRYFTFSIWAIAPTIGSGSCAVTYSVGINGGAAYGHGSVGSTYGQILGNSFAGVSGSPVLLTVGVGKCKDASGNGLTGPVNIYFDDASLLQSGTFG